MYHIPGAEPIHNQFNTGSGEYYPAQFSSGWRRKPTARVVAPVAVAVMAGRIRLSLPPIDPKAFGNLNDAPRLWSADHRHAV